MMKAAPEITKGSIVTIRPEWRDRDESFTYVCINEPEEGRVKISPVRWPHGDIVPVELVRVEMLEVAE